MTYELYNASFEIDAFVFLFFFFSPIPSVGSNYEIYNASFEIGAFVLLFFPSLPSICSSTVALVMPTAWETFQLSSGWLNAEPANIPSMVVTCGWIERCRKMKERLSVDGLPQSSKDQALRHSNALFDRFAPHFVVGQGKKQPIRA